MALLALAFLLAGCDWYQFGGGPQHAGFSIETGISVDNVSQLHQHWQVTLPSQPGGAPVVVSGVKTPQGKKTLAFVSTTEGALLAYDAAVGGAPIWEVSHPAGTCKVQNDTAPCDLIACAETTCSSQGQRFTAGHRVRHR